MRLLDLDNWERKEHFKFFSQFEEPLFGICVEVDCTTAYERAKALNTSFFLYYLHKSITAVNQTEAFRYRINAENKVVVHDRIDASATINRENGTFGFSYITYQEDYDSFVAGARQEIQRVRQTNTLLPSESGDQVIHYSAIPWIKFTSISHARSFTFKDSVPKISFGKLSDVHKRKIMPVSIHVHHGLMDAFHVAQHLEKFQDLLNA